MICKNCGSEIEETSLFCPTCGMPQDHLIQLVLSGDQDAFERLYNYSYQGVYWTIHSMANLDENTVYDIMQDSYLRAYRSLSRLKEPVKFEKWINQIAHNVTLDYLRKGEKNKAIFFSETESEDFDFEEFAPQEESIEKNPEASMEYKERSRLLNEILEQLPDEQRIVLSMYYMQELTAKEIAQELGVNEHTVKSRLSYGKKKVEKSVLDLEKKGVSLLGFTAMGFFTWLLTGIRADAAEEIPDTVLQGLQKGILESVPEAGTTANDASVKKEAVRNAGREAAKTAGKEAAKTAGKTGAAKIIVGVLAIAVVGGGIGSMVYTLRNRVPESEETSYDDHEEIPGTEETESEAEIETESEIETGSETETETESETESVTEIETEFEQVAKPKTETETQRTASLSDDAVILNTIQNMGYEYIGGNSYDVLYQGGFAFTENAGMLQEPPVGVASYAVADLDGDGEDELLLVTLEPTERIYDTSGLQDSRLAFTVCENMDGAWVASQSVSQVNQVTIYGDSYQTDIMTIADVLPCISIYLVPSGSGMSILIDNPFYGSFPADNFFETFEIIYTEEGMFIREYGGTTDPTSEELEIQSLLQQAMQSADSILISKIYLPEFFSEESRLDGEMYGRLASGQDTPATLVLEDYRYNEEREGGDEEGPEAEGTEAEVHATEEPDIGGLLIIYEE